MINLATRFQHAKNMLRGKVTKKIEELKSDFMALDYMRIFPWK